MLDPAVIGIDDTDYVRRLPAWSDDSISRLTRLLRQEVTNGDSREDGHRERARTSAPAVMNMGTGKISIFVNPGAPIEAHEAC